MVNFTSEWCNKYSDNFTVSPLRIMLWFLVMAGFWFICSGKLSLFFFLAGVISIGLVLFLVTQINKVFINSIPTPPLSEKLYKNSSSKELEFIGDELSNKLVHTPTLKLIFFIRLLKEMFVSSLKMAKIIWLNREQVQPVISWVEASTGNENTQAIEVNAITLTPGTMTLELKDNKILIHAINQEFFDEVEKE